MAHVIRGRSNGKNYSIVLRNPAEKAERFAKQMKAGVIKETGEILTATDMAWRAGYLAARADSAKAYNSNRRKKNKIR